MIRAGSLKHQITIQENTGVTNASGEIVQDWTDFATIRASILPLSGKELITAQQVASEITHKVRIRYLPDICAKQRIVFGCRIFEIVSVINTGEGNRELEILCKELTERLVVVSVTGVEKISSTIFATTWELTFSQDIISIPDTVTGWNVSGFAIHNAVLDGGKLQLTRNGGPIFLPPESPHVFYYSGADGSIIAANGYHIDYINYAWYG